MWYTHTVYRTGIHPPTIKSCFFYFYHSLVYTSLKIDRFSRHQAKLLYFISARLWIWNVSLLNVIRTYTQCIVCICYRRLESLCSVLLHQEENCSVFYFINEINFNLKRSSYFFTYGLSCFFFFSFLEEEGIGLPKIVEVFSMLIHATLSELTELTADCLKSYLLQPRLFQKSYPKTHQSCCPVLSHSVKITLGLCHLLISQTKLEENHP